MFAAIWQSRHLANNPRSGDMQRLTLMTATAAMLFGGVLAGTPAKAEYHFGPMKNGSQCYSYSTNGWNNQGFGVWKNCANEAATPTAHHHAKKS
jgi:hypothetical protein